MASYGSEVTTALLLMSTVLRQMRNGVMAFCRLLPTTRQTIAGKQGITQVFAARAFKCPRLHVKVCGSTIVRNSLGHDNNHATQISWGGFPTRKGDGRQVHLP